MFEITLCAMGRLKEPFYLSAAAEYEKRLSGFCRFRVLELPEERLPQDPAPAQIAGALEKEAAALFSRLPAGAWLCVLTSEGKELTSQRLAQTMAKVKLSGKSHPGRDQIPQVGTAGPGSRRLLFVVKFSCEIP